MDIRRRATINRQDAMEFNNTFDMTQFKEERSDVRFLLMIWDQIRQRGLLSVHKSDRERVVKILIEGIPQLNQLFKMNQDKFLDTLKAFRVERLVKNDFLTNATGSFKKVYLLLIGTVMTEFGMLSRDKTIDDKDNFKVFSPLMLLGTDLVPTPQGHQVRKAYIRTHEAVLLSADSQAFARLTYGVVPNSAILRLVEGLKNCPVLKNLTPHQIVNIGFAGKVWTLEKRTIIVKQGQPLNYSLLSKQKVQEGYLYITMQGNFSIQSMISAGAPEELDLERYLANYHTSKEVPLMKDQPTYSFSPRSKPYQKNYALKIFGSGEVLGIIEQKHSEKSWRYSLVSEEQGVRVLEVDLQSIGGWKYLSEQLGFDSDLQLTQFIEQNAVRCQTKMSSIGKSVEKDGERLGQFLIKKCATINQQSISKMSVDYRNQTDENQITITSTLPSKSIKVKLNYSPEPADAERLVNDLVVKKGQILSKIQPRHQSVNDAPKSLVEEFSSFDPYFLKLLRIKIFSETYNPHQNSIFHQIKMMLTQKNNRGIYNNKVRSNSCADGSFILLNGYKQATDRDSKRKSKFIRIADINQPAIASPNTTHRTFSNSNAIKNVKRKLRSSRRSNQLVRPMTQERMFNIDDDQSLQVTSNNQTQRLNTPLTVNRSQYLQNL